MEKVKTKSGHSNLVTVQTDKQNHKPMSGRHHVFHSSVIEIKQMVLIP